MVVDLGVAKTVRYSAAQKASVLSRTWLAKASATQRAGRTGRVRAGTVFRLYTQALFDALPAHDVSAICEQPLESTVLQLRGMLSSEQSVSSLLEEAIEPPELSAVGSALVSLASMGFLHVQPSLLPHGAARGSSASAAVAAAADAELRAALVGLERDPASGFVDAGVDEVEHVAHSSSLFFTYGGRLAALDCATLTPSGALAAALPLDYKLSRVISLGVQLDCAAEAIVLAAALAMPKPVFRTPSPLVQPLAEYNELVRVVSEGRRVFDRGGQSEALSYLNLYAALRCQQQLRQSSRARGSSGGGGGADEALVEEAAEVVEAAEAASAEVVGGLEAHSDAALRQHGAPKARAGMPAPIRIDAAWCAKYGLAQRQVRAFTSSVSTLIRIVSRQLGLAADQLALDEQYHLRAGREASFCTARLRALLVWSFPEALISAVRPHTRRGQGGGGGVAGGGAGGPEIGGGGVGGGADDAADASLSVHLGVVVSEPLLRGLLPAPILWTARTRCCDLVQVSHARLPGQTVEALHTVIQGTLIPWLAPDFVFVQTPLERGADRLTAWVDTQRMAADVRERMVAILRLPSQALEQYVELAGDPAAYAAQQSTASGAGGDGRGRDAHGAGRRYARFAVTMNHADRPQQKAFEHFRSRRGLACDHRVVALRVQPNATATFLAANCLPLAVPTAGSGGRAGGAAGLALSGDALALLAALLGPSAQCSLKPGQAEARQTLYFAAEDQGEAPTAPQAVPPAPGQPPLPPPPPPPPPIIHDRPWGVRLMCLMASGHKDRLLRVGEPETPAAQPNGLAVPMSCPIGLDWSLQGCGRHAARALLPRFSLLRVALPQADEDLRLWAVASSVLELGGSSGGGGGAGGGSGAGGRGSIVAVEYPTLLPPGDEWLAAVLRCASATAQLPGRASIELSASQRADADAVRNAFDLSLLEVQPVAVGALRRLLDPWLAGERIEGVSEGEDDAQAGGGDAAADCPICFSYVHPSTGQLPRVRCNTCPGRFHAACIYRWFRANAEAHELSGGDGPRRDTCPLCRSDF